MKHFCIVKQNTNNLKQKIMKKIFTTCMLLCSMVVAALAGNDLTISGTLTEAGTVLPLANYEVCAQSDSSSGVFLYGCAYTDSNGFYSIFIAGGSVNGSNINFYVTTLSCNQYLTQTVANNQGITDAATVNFAVCVSNPTSCSSSVVAIPDSTVSSSSYFIYGNVFENGNQIFNATYSWDFGDSTYSTLEYNQHVFPGPGTYSVCLTTITPGACTSYSCQTIVVTGQPACQASFSFQQGAGNDVYFVSTSSGAVPVSYLWDFGDSSAYSTLANPVHSYATAGIYAACLTIATSSGCTVTYCAQINTLNTASFYLAGQVWAGANAADYGTVFLIQLDSLNLHLVDTASIDTSGHYNFYAPQGVYLVKAALSTNSAYHNNYMPTYLDSTLFWINAFNVNVLNTNILNADIHLVSGNNPGGPGFIGGNILQGANRLASPGDPIQGVSILLLDMNNNPVAATTTDISGHYSFNNLPYGTYQVYTEVAGKTTVPSVVTIDATSPSIANVDITVNSGNILGIKSAKANEIAIGLFPNPVKDFASISLSLDKASLVSVSIVNELGQVLISNEYNLSVGKHNIVEVTETLAKGIYSVVITDNASNTRVVKKFVKSE